MPDGLLRFASKLETVEFIELDREKIEETWKLIEAKHGENLLGFHPWVTAYGRGFSILHHRLPTMVNRQVYTVSFEMADFLLDRCDLEQMHYADANEALRTYRSALRPFSGWSICLKREFAEHELFQTLRETLKAEKGSGPSIAPSIGRPRKQEDVVTAYLKFFGNHEQSRGGKTWKELTYVIEKELGYTVSQRTVEDAIKRYEKSTSEEGKKPN